MTVSETDLMTVSRRDSDHLDSRSRPGAKVAMARIVVTSKLPSSSIPADFKAQVNTFDRSECKLCTDSENVSHCLSW
jgi:hypothetical protein